MSRNRSIVLTDGSILKALTKLAMPIIGTSFVQMAYGFIDMIWVGESALVQWRPLAQWAFSRGWRMLLSLFLESGPKSVAQSIGGNDPKEQSAFAIVFS